MGALLGRGGIYGWGFAIYGKSAHFGNVGIYVGMWEYVKRGIGGGLFGKRG